MLSNLFKKKINKVNVSIDDDATTNVNTATTNDSDDVSLSFSYSKIPMSIELHKRQQEEALRKKHGITRKKKAEFL